MIASFGPFEVDLDRLEIRDDGDVVSVEPQVFDVLSYLIEHRDRMVSKEELLDNIWGDRFVSESALTSRIKSARQALGDDGRTQAVIKTIHGRGYRFVAETRLGDAPNPAPATPIESDRVGTVRTAEPDAPELDDRWPLVGRHDEVDVIGRAFTGGQHDGVLLTGPAGIGKTRLARVCTEQARRDGLPTAHVSGHAESEQIPLASLAHLLPPDVLEAGSTAGELARTIVFQRARAALDGVAAGKRLVLFVDNADHVDEMSAALIGSLVASRSIFAILTQRTAPGDALVAEELVRSNQIVHVELAPLDDTDLDVLLYRVLAGPIDLGSLQQLTALSHGRPGALQHLVETSLANRALDRQADVWRLVGPIEPSAGHPGTDRLDIGSLEPATRNGAELLAVAEEMDLDVATEVVGADVLDTLDRSGLLALRDVNTRPRVSLAHPHVELLLLERLGPLRTRRHKARLIAALAPHDLLAEDEIRAVHWHIETGTDISADRVLASARLAVANVESTAADELLDHLDRTAPTPEVGQLRAELFFRRGQMGHAERLLEDLDVDQLAPTVAARVLRRRATIMFHVRARFDDALALLDDHLERFDGDARNVIAAHRIGLAGFLGRADQIFGDVADLTGDVAGSSQLEIQRGLAQAHVVRGSFTQALEVLDVHDRDLAALPPRVAQAGVETSMASRITALTGIGRIREAGELVQRHLPIGKRTLLAWLPMAAARSELIRGHAHIARELISTPLAAVRSQNLLHAEPQMQGLFAQANVRLGEIRRARGDIATAEATLDSLTGQLRWALVLSVADVRLLAGKPESTVEMLIAEADAAHAAGALVTEAELLTTAARCDAAETVVDRLVAVAAEIEGDLWPLRVRHVTALANGATDELRDVAGDYRSLGYDGFASGVEAALRGPER